MSIMTAEPSDTQFETVPRVEHGMVWLPDDNASIPRHDWADNVDVVLWYGECEDPETPKTSYGYRIGTRYSVRHQNPELGIEYDLTPHGGLRAWIDPEDGEDLVTAVNADLRMIYGPHILCILDADDSIDIVDLSK